MTFAARRWLAVMLTLLAAVGLWAALRAAYADWRQAAYCSGWILLGTMLFLTLYNLRKKLPYPPLLSSAAWLQLHAYVGLLTVFLFALHIGLRIPNGPFEITLAVVFTLVAGSGIIGLAMSRAIQQWLSARGEEVLFERIPIYRRQLHERAEELVVASVEKSQTMTLADFHRQMLADYFAGPRNIVWHLCQSSRPARRLAADLRQLDRYLNDDERAIAGDLGELIRRKDDLDYHCAMQGALKLWLFVHIPLTYGLLILTFVHVVLVHAFVARW
jgi:hypothetical protein